ncbi:hypothetical protein NFI96_021374, partial [Prochilodus magdalenae]
SPLGQRPLAKVEHYEDTEPWLLIGGQKRPISLLQTIGHPASLKLLIEVESEQLLLILQKNEPPFHYSSYILSSPSHMNPTQSILLLYEGIDQRGLIHIENFGGGEITGLFFLVWAQQQYLTSMMLVRNRGLFASHYTETHYLEGGKAVTTSPSSAVNCYYHGEVKGHQHSDVILSTCTGLRGLITLRDKALVLEPALKPNSTMHHIYRGEHLNLTQGTCGHGHNISHPAGVPNTLGSFFNSHSMLTRHKRHAQSNAKYVELIIVADNREYQKQGKDVEKVKQRLAEIANYVDKFYRALNIRVALVGLEVWSDSDKCPVTQDPFTTLHEFLDWRKLKLLPQRPHDNAQLISGVYFQGTTIGMAPIMSMCTAEQSGGIVMDHSDNPLGAAVTLAHELGHNFGMNHDTPERGCGCRVTADRGGCIMTPSTGYPFPTVFSSCSKKDLLVSLEKGVGMCLFNMPEVKVLYGGQKCGNGYVEEGEECDCGDLEECMNPCCNASTCTLKGNAVCAHGQCCEDCQLKPAGTPCRESSNSCDLPEFCTGSDPHCPANVYLHDGHSCHSVDGHCYNGICQTHEQQCITLWGQGAKPAPGICFERVNSAGDPYGNCGKDSKGSFAKCEKRDAKCGKIQCQGGANRPVIGTNAVSIETNIPLQEGGRILCRGTHVYLGDDMPDPGLVLTGTKCGENMGVCQQFLQDEGIEAMDWPARSPDLNLIEHIWDIMSRSIHQCHVTPQTVQKLADALVQMCLNRQCQNISVFGVHECSAKCSGRGVCNNKKNCHCEAHWAPPFCDKAGFGGSVDSGPMRLADSESVKVGIVVAFLCLLCVGMIVCIKRKTLASLFISNKKNTIEKLRSVGPNGPASPGHTFSTSQTHVGTHTHSACRASSQCQAPAISQSASIYKELEKPTPPQKPLPADPLGRSIRLMRSPSAVRLPAPIPTSTPRSVPPLMQPNRSAHAYRPPPKQPPTLPKPQFLTGMPKPSS